jgi:hypothetical protein
LYFAAPGEAKGIGWKKDIEKMKTHSVIVAFAAALSLSACGDSNPLVGKWVVDGTAPGANPFTAIACGSMGEIEFTDKSMVVRGVSNPVTYDRDGSKWTINGAGQDGKGLIIEMNGSDSATIVALGCQIKKTG